MYPNEEKGETVRRVKEAKKSEKNDKKSEEKGGDWSWRGAGKSYIPLYHGIWIPAEPRDTLFNYWLRGAA